MKYIVEIKPEYEDSFKGVMILGAKDSNLFVDTLAVENLEQYTPVDIEKIYDTACTDGYNRGLEDGKAIHEKGCEGCKFEGTEIYHRPCCACRNVYPNQWAAKDDKIVVGDEVIYNGTTKCVVVTPETDEKYASLFDCNGIHYSADHRECKKTGRHFDIQKILEEMRND